MMLPRVAIVDPDLTIELPPTLTAYTGMDALTQCIEPYVSSRANALTDLYCLEGIRRASRSLLRAHQDGSDVEARTDMAYASLLGGFALANSGLGVVHGFAAPIGGMFDAPHGAVCAALLEFGIAQNIRALKYRAPQDQALDRYREIAAILTGNPNAQADDGVRWVSRLTHALGIPRLSSFGMRAEHVPAVVKKAAQASSMKANPIVLTSEELECLLRGAITPAGSGDDRRG
jgi:alcohol dehydrogenase class IV